MHILLIFCTLLLVGTSIGEHVTVTYHYWEKNDKIVERVEWFTKFVANSNRFWTSNLVYLQQNDKVDRIQISSESWKSATVEDTITEMDHLDSFFVSLFQRFADKLYTNLALDSLPVFDPSVFQKSYHAYENYEINAQSVDTFKFDYWLKISDEGGQRGNRHVFALLTRKESFEQWEAIMTFVDSLKRSNQKGYIVDCGKENTVCPTTENTDIPVLYVFRDDEIQLVYDGDFQKDHVYDWMLTIKQPEIKLLKEEIVPQYRSGIIPGFDRPRDTVTILFIHTKKSKIWQNYVKFAKENYGKYHLTALISEEVKKWSIYPAFITMKPQDDYVKAFTLHKDIDWNRMVEYLEDGVHPGCHPMTCASEFLFATSTAKPLVVYFDPLNTKNATAFKMAASQEQTGVRSAHFAAVTGFDLFGLYIMSVFNVNTPSYVVILRQEKGWCIFSRDIENDTFSSIRTWVRNLEPTICPDFIEDFKFPITRLNLLERYEDVDELEREHTSVERNRDEL
ncbi:hypothetical protein GCK72_006961 [Caenorhabditis remanei]|uniref:Thioredoxin domain-containing protein n=1 Tax=Caenorhabditis remanei TaxID=31234 RepID=A0A6A5HKU2_CAERE|nr:hypothetical protein GCK72_006961 [Caenorhabditis remanei]KAF1767003.1 hypothetical protein GCK72_006961 [Caenorhabditis remanei]